MRIYNLHSTIIFSSDDGYTYPWDIEISSDTTNLIHRSWGKETLYSMGKMNIYPSESGLQKEKYILNVANVYFNGKSPYLPIRRWASLMKMRILPSRKGLNQGNPVSNHSLDVFRIDFNTFRTVRSHPSSPSLLQLKYVMQVLQLIFSTP